MAILRWFNRLFRQITADSVNRVFDTLDTVSDTLCKGIKELMDLLNKVSSMTYFPDLRITP